MARIHLDASDFSPTTIPPPATGVMNAGLEIVTCRKLTELGYGDLFMRKYLDDIDIADFETIAAQVETLTGGNIRGIGGWRYTISSFPVAYLLLCRLTRSGWRR